MYVSFPYFCVFGICVLQHLLGAHQQMACNIVCQIFHFSHCQTNTYTRPNTHKHMYIIHTHAEHMSIPHRRLICSGYCLGKELSRLFTFSLQAERGVRRSAPLGIRKKMGQTFQTVSIKPENAYALYDTHIHICFKDKYRYISLVPSMNTLQIR